MTKTVHPVLKKTGAVLLTMLVLVLMAVPAFAVTLPDAPTGYVYDGANVLSSSTESYIERTGSALAEACGAEVVVATVDFTDGEDIADYAYDLFNKWGIGDKKANNGLLILLSVGAEDYYAEPGVGLTDVFTGGVLDATVKGEPGALKMPPEHVKAACDEAHRLGYKVAAHVESPEGVRVALENGVDTIEHGAKPDEHIISLFKERGAALVTTISPALPYALFDTAVSGASEKDQYNGKIVFDGVVESAKTALANGIPVGLGNDVGCPYITQYDFWRELCYFHKYCGVSNQFALYTATLRNAQLAGVGDVTGSIEPGKSADFIVTKHNPLEDLRALQHLELVVCRGHVIKKPNPKRNKTVDALLDPYLE